MQSVSLVKEKFFDSFWLQGNGDVWFMTSIFLFYMDNSHFWGIFFPLFFFYSTSTFDLTATLCNLYYGILWPCKLIYNLDKLEGYNQTEEICNFLTSNSAIWPRWCSLCILTCMWFWLQNNRFQERNSSKEKKEDHEQIFASKSPNHYLCINAITSESVALWIYQILNWLENVKIIEIA